MRISIVTILALLSCSIANAQSLVELSLKQKEHITTFCLLTNKVKS